MFFPHGLIAQVGAPIMEAMELWREPCQLQEQVAIAKQQQPGDNNNDGQWRIKDGPRYGAVLGCGTNDDGNTRLEPEDQEELCDAP